MSGTSRRILMKGYPDPLKGEDNTTAYRVISAAADFEIGNEISQSL